MRRYESYLFDVDGTLIDTAELIYQCFVYSCRRFAGIEIRREQVVSNIGLPLRQQFEVCLGALSNERAREIMDAHMEYQLSIYRRYLRAFPSVAEGLRLLKAAGRRLGVVTSRRQRTLTLYLQETGLYDFFDVFVTPESTDKHKPDPAPVRKALVILGCDSRQALLVGDSSFDIECGDKAGLDTAYVAWSHNPVSSLAVRPTYTVDDLTVLAAA